jgi:hypothetical protein
VYGVTMQDPGVSSVVHRGGRGPGMTRGGRVGAALALILLGASSRGAVSVPGDVIRGEGSLGAELTGVELVVPGPADTLTTVTPSFIVRAVNPQAADRPIRLGLQISFSPGFTGPMVVDTFVLADTATIALTRPLTSNATIFVRATARASGGDPVVSPSTSRVVPAWVVLVSPNDPNGASLETPRPRFVWSSPDVAAPPGPWTYDLEIRNVGSGSTQFFPNLGDTTFVPPMALEFNTSYRWSVTARVQSGQSVTATSRSSFVVVNPGVPLATLLYQNFPNPFPTATSAATCIWFDLAASGPVSLDVFDLSGRHVVTIVPGPGRVGFFEAGRHGRAPIGSTEPGCNGDIRWDGRGRDGEVVPAGVYLLRLRASGIESVKKIVFRGRP